MEAPAEVKHLFESQHCCDVGRNKSLLFNGSANIVVAHSSDLSVVELGPV
jgi:hypothetical protein